MEANYYHGPRDVALDTVGHAVLGDPENVVDRGSAQATPLVEAIR